MFKLDERLAADTHLLMDDDIYTYLLNKNAEVAWLILVPHIEQTEFYHLKPDVQNRLCEQINRLSKFIESGFSIDKLNVATIGNVVSQMHVHVIGRRKDDAYWPDVVWGKAFEKTYTKRQVDSIRSSFCTFMQAS